MSYSFHATSNGSITISTNDIIRASMGIIIKALATFC